MKVVINKSCGSFDMSHEAVMRYLKVKGIKMHVYKKEYPDKLRGKDKSFQNKGVSYYYTKKPFKGHDILFAKDRLILHDLKRDDKDLIKIIEGLGEKANGNYNKLKIVEIPDDIDWYIENFCNHERIVEKNKVWN